MNDIENIQKQIIELQKQITTLQEQFNNLKKGYYDWDNAPTIVEINGFKWLLGPEAPNELNWDDAITWCNSVGGELPPRVILFLCYMNEEIKKEFWEVNYWSSTEFSTSSACWPAGPCAPVRRTEFSTSSAWGQTFHNGGQNDRNKTSSLYVRAVKKLQIY